MSGFRDCAESWLRTRRIPYRVATTAVVLHLKARPITGRILEVELYPSPIDISTLSMAASKTP